MHLRTKILFLITVLINIFCTAQSIKPNNTIIVRGSDNYPPFEFINEDGEPDGFNVEIFKAVMEQTKIPYSLKLENFENMIADLDSAKIDLVIGMIYSPERAKKYRFCIPTCIMNRCIFTRKDSPIKSASDLKGKEVAVQKHGWSHNYLLQSKLTDKIIPTPNTKDALIKLSEGEYDAVLGNKLLYLSTLNKYNLSNIDIIPIDIEPQNYSMAVNINDEALLEKLNFGLQQLKANGEYDRIYNKWFGIYEDKNLSERAWTIIFIIVGICIIILSFVITLKAQVRRATKRLYEANKKLEDNKIKTELSMQSSGITQWDYDVQTKMFSSIISYDISLKDDLTKDKFLNIVFEEDRQEAKHMIEHMDKQIDSSINCEFRIIDNGNIKWHSTTACPSLYDKKGKVIRYAGLSKNNNKLREMLAELTKLKDKAERSDLLKSAFLANMSHEIRTPLNAIVGFSNLLGDVKDPEEREEYKRIIDSNNELLLQLINDILDLSKIESGYLSVKDQNINLYDFFSDIDTTFSNRMPNGVELKIDIPSEPHFIVFDRDRLNQLIGNFINNAIKFTEKGSITAGYKITDTGIKLYVRDTGCGISEENKKKVFERFEKLNDYVQGTGLGLSICKAIAESKNGSIGVDSKEGAGSTFWVEMPCKIDEVKKTLNDASARKSRKIYKPLPEQKKMKVLIVEDDENNYTIIHSILKDECDILHCTSGEDAVEMVKKEKPNIVLMDIKLPMMDGLEATKAIREFDDDTPIIAITAYTLDNNKNKAFAAGCDDFLPKPLNRDAVYGAIEKMENKK